MKGSTAPQTLRMLVWNEWLVETIIKLGSGYSTHLSYQYSEIEPQVLQDIHHSTLSPGVFGEIIHQGKQPPRKVALAEVFKLNDFRDSIRFDIRLLSVDPFIRNGIVQRDSEYACFYLK